MATMVLLSALPPPGILLCSYLQGHFLTCSTAFWVCLCLLPQLLPQPPISVTLSSWIWKITKHTTNFFFLSFSPSHLTKNLSWAPRNSVLILHCILYNLVQYPVPKRHSTNTFWMNQSSLTCTDLFSILRSFLPPNFSFYSFSLSNLPI